MFRRSAPRFAAAFALIAFGASFPAQAAVTVFLDYTDFQTRLNSATTSAGVSSFNSSEVSQIQANILGMLQSTYANFSISFTQTAPVSGNFETLQFGATTTQTGLFGLADRIDFRNLNANDTARVYTANFSSFIETGDSRANQILEISRALGGTAAHELGHNCGLEHCDCYGDPGITPANYSNTNRIQNQHIMATGITGLNETERESLRTFSQLETAKLEFSASLNPNAPSVLAEQLVSHSTFATAQAVSLTSLTISKTNGFALTGNISASGEVDFYSFTASANSFLTAQIISSSLSDRYANTVDSILTIFDPLGNQLFLQDDIALGATTFNSGTTYSTDSLGINIPLLMTGDYRIRVSGFQTDTGNYELLGIVAPPTATAPEPGTLALVLLGAFIPVRRLTRRRS
jgi:hypothetical protein